jgi:protoporphyrinogen oxidase
MYDFIIIGGGIAGLYSAYQLKKRYPHIRLCILEKEERIGGRMGSEDFHGVSIAMGAGVGRKKDVLLIQINYFESRSRIIISFIFIIGITITR